MDHDVVAGTDPKSLQTVTLSERQRSTHVYACGTTGSGKSRWLENLIFQDIRNGHPVMVIDAMGDLFARIVEYTASGLEEAGSRGFPVVELLDRYLFLDAGDPENALRINPLAATSDETSEQLVDDILRAFERQTGAMEEQQRRRMILRGIFHLTASLNTLPAERRPRMPPGVAATYPLNLTFASDILAMSDEERFTLLGALPDGARLRWQRLYWEFFAQGAALEKFRQLQSTFTALQYLLDDDLVLRVLDTHHSTLSIADAFRQGRSLICHLPIGGNLSGASFLGRFLTTKLQQAAYRRPEAEWRHRYYLYLDEFHLFADAAFAESFTNLRKFGISITVAHQSQTQPPFDSPEGQSLLNTIKGNTHTHAIFRLARPDAEIMSRDLFELTQRRENFRNTEIATSTSEQSSSSVARSTGRTEGSGEGWSQARTSGTGSQETSEEAGSRRSGVSATSSLRDDRSTLRRTDFSSGEQHTEGTTRGQSETRTTRTIYYPLEGERELMTNVLQKLSNRQCYLSTGALQGRVVETPFVPDELYCYQTVNFPAELLEWQRRRLQRQMQEASEELAEEVSTRILPFAPVIVTAPQATSLSRVESEEAPDPKGQQNYPFVD